MDGSHNAGNVFASFHYLDASRSHADWSLISYCLCLCRSGHSLLHHWHTIHWGAESRDDSLLEVCPVSWWWLGSVSSWQLHCTTQSLLPSFAPLLLFREFSLLWWCCTLSPLSHHCLLQTHRGTTHCVWLCLELHCDETARCSCNRWRHGQGQETASQTR